MVEPASIAAAVAKLVDSASEETGKQMPGLLARVFGPTADEIGQYLGQLTAHRLKNIGKIAEVADEKSGELGRDGIINPRVAYTMLEAGSFCDDEVMADYLGGVLAAGRTPSGRDDRAVTWSNLITSMSALELRAHFVLYREWAHGLHDLPSLELTKGMYRAQMCVDLTEFVTIIGEASPDVPADAILPHVLAGLRRWDFIENDFCAGLVEKLRPIRSDLPTNLPFERVFSSTPTMAGMELYGWACGLPGLDPDQFVTSPEIVETDVPLSRPTVVFPLLPATEPPPPDETA